MCASYFPLPPLFPWAPSDCLRSLSSGIVGDSSINCDRAWAVGADAMSTMKGSFYDIKLSRKNRVRPLSTLGKTVTIRGEVIPVNVQQLFMRLVWVINSQDCNLMEYLKYELAPIPPALFDDISMRKTTKSTLLQVFDSGPASNTVFEGTSVIIDGGYLLHVMVWPRPATFGVVMESYRQYVLKHYSASATVLFDGYDETASTKGAEQKRRASRKYSNNIAFDSNTFVSISQADFLSNSHNKTRLITLLTRSLREVGVTVHQAKGDADTLIVSTALQECTTGRDVLVVSTDTDVLVMLVARSEGNPKLTVLHPGTRTVPSKMYDVSQINEKLGSTKECLLFSHAVSGCDTTSAIYGKGKKKLGNCLKRPPS